MKRSEEAGPMTVGPFKRQKTSEHPLERDNIENQIRTNPSGDL